MTKQDFIQRKKRYFRTSLVPGLITALLMAGLPLVWLCLAVTHPDWPKALRTVGCLFCVAVLIGALWFIYWQWPRIEKRIGFKCSKCQKTFFATEEVLATGKCDNCGAQVLDEVA
jgi:DNA-directed RNA polymerase subunit RPC12/RpoP